MTFYERISRHDAATKAERLAMTTIVLFILIQIGRAVVFLFFWDVAMGYIRLPDINLFQAWLIQLVLINVAISLKTGK